MSSLNVFYVSPRGDKLTHASTTIEQAENFAEYLNAIGITSAKVNDIKEYLPGVTVDVGDQALLVEKGYTVKPYPFHKEQEPVGPATQAVTTGAGKNAAWTRS